MARLRLAWLLSLALMALGGVVAHVLTYRLVLPAPGGGHHTHVSHTAGVSHWELCFAVCGSVALVGIAVSLVSTLERGRSFRLPLWPVALVPPAGFVVQEHLKGFVELGGFPQGVVLEPVFVVGVLLQLPFALVAFLAARALVALTVALVETLRAPPRPRVVAVEPVLLIAPDLGRPFASVLARGFGQRAPPVPVA